MDNTTTQQVPNIQQQNNQSLDEKLTDLQDKWTDYIKELNDQMKNLTSIDGLLNEVYSKRQDAVDLYYGTYKILSKQTREYRVQAAQLYNALKTGSNNIRYTNENAINMQIEAQLSDKKDIIDTLTSFTNYMKDTIQTIDNIIYGINSKIKIYEMIHGLKF